MSGSTKSRGPDSTTIIPGNAEDRYNRAADKRLLIKWIVALAVIALVGVGSTLYSKSLFDAAKHERETILDDAPLDVDSVYTDRVESAYDIDYDRAPYKTIAKSLEKDSVWIDDYSAFEVDDDDIAAIKDEVGTSPSGIPVVVAFVVESDYDDADGDLDLIGGRIAREMSVRPVTVAVIGKNQNEAVTVGGYRDALYSDGYADDFHAKYQSKNALSYVKALNAGDAEVDATQVTAGEISERAPVVAERDDDSGREPLHYSALSWTFGIVFGVAIGFILTGLTKLLLRIITKK